MPSFCSPSLSSPHLGPSSRLRLDISRPFVPQLDYLILLEKPVDKKLPGRPAGCDIFLELLGYSDLGCTQLLEALVNQQEKYECGQDHQPGGGQDTGTAQKLFG